jgi:PAS domain S-box-containing protein
MKNNIKFILQTALLFIFLVPSVLSAVEPIIAGDKPFSGELIGRNLEYLEDKGGKLNISDILKNDVSSGFKSSDGDILLPELFSKSVFWIRFSVQNERTDPVDWKLELTNLLIDHVDLYIPERGGFNVKTGGAMHPFNTREYNFRTQIFSIVSPPGKSFCYMRIQSRSHLVIALKKWSIERLSDHISIDNNIHSLFNGLCIGIMLINLFLFFYIRDRSFLLLSFAILSGLILDITWKGHAFQYIWPDTAWMNDSVPFLFTLFLLVLIIFSRSYLRTNIYTPRLDRIFRVYTAVLVVLLVVDIPGFFDAGVTYAIALYICMPLMLLGYIQILISAVISTRKNYMPSRYWLIANIANFITINIAALKFFGIEINDFLTNYGDNIGYNTFNVLITLGLADRIKTSMKRSEDLNRSLQMEVVERMRSESALSEERERLSITLASIGDGVIATDVDGRITVMNRVAEEVTGWDPSESAGKMLYEIFKIYHGTGQTAVSSEIMRQGLLGLTIEYNDYLVLVSRDGTEKKIALTGSPIRITEDGAVIGIVIVFRDISQKLKIEEELVKIQKLESLGILAGTIAHDFNNILTALLGNISLAKMTAEKQSMHEITELLNTAETASHQAKNLANQFLTFAKGGAPVKKTVSLKEAIVNAAELVLKSSDVRASYNINENLYPVNADLNQFSQVIQNIVINASQAMPSGGNLKINADNADQNGSQSGKYVKITISDKGIGIPQSNLAKIFDPFFTTKESGHGLGLAGAKSIIKNHDGKIAAESVEGKGATFTIFLPASDTGPDTTGILGENASCLQGRALVMDDDKGVLGAVSRMLEYLGLEVETAIEGTKAVEIYRESFKDGRSFDVVILDLTIQGGMGGADVIKQLLEIDPGVRAVVSSGYNSDPVMAEFEKYGFSGFIIKPYRLNDIASVLKKIFSAPRGGRTERIRYE